MRIISPSAPQRGSRSRLSHLAGLTLSTLVAAVLTAVPLGAQAAASACPDPATLNADLQGPIRHVRFLADDALEGREVGSPGARCAADYLAATFSELGLEPAGDDGGYFQSFQARVGTVLGAHNLLEIDGASYPLGDAWVPYGYTGAGMVEGVPVDAGQVAADGSAELGHAELAGKLLVVEGVSDQPEGFDAHYLATTAQNLGAGGLIVIAAGGLPAIERETRRTLSIPVAAVAGRAARALREAARSGSQVSLMTMTEPRTAEARNVAALLRGTGGPDAGVVIVGAHYDHLGMGGDGSLAPDAVGVVHNGGDDNASGTAALIEVARALAASQSTEHVLFLAFTGEEKGLWGAGHFVNQPTVPLERVKAMLNMDMVGRLGDGKLTVFGVGTAGEWMDVLEASNGALAEPIELATAPDGYGPSDHSAFYGKGIPVLHFFTNTHADYHRPTDDWEKIDAEGLARVVELVAAVAQRAAAGPQVRLSLIEGAGSPSQAPATDPGQPSDPSASRGYGPYLGTVPDMTPGDAEGVRLTGVREASPAALAGLRAGDVIVEFAGTPVTDLYAYTYALREHRPGDEVEIVVLRDGERVSLTAVLGRR